MLTSATSTRPRSEQTPTTMALTVFDASPIGMALVDGDGVVQRTNAALDALVGRPVVARPFEELFRQSDAAQASAAVTRGRPTDAVLAESGRITQVHGAPVPDQDAMHVVQVLDVTDQREQAIRLQDLADHDSLTGLLNRRRFGEEIDVALNQARRTGTDGALLLLDLDGFKYVNDTLGHAAGDALIRDVAVTLRGLVRRHDVVGRLGGDEFGVLLRDTSLPEASAIAESITCALRQRVRPGHEAPVVTASVGIAHFGEDVEVPHDELLAWADMAMYEAKAHGRNRVVVFDRNSGMRERMSHQQQWTTRLRRAVEDDRLVLLAQAIVPLRPTDDPAPLRAELLLRYRNDDDELIPPSVFLPVAERTDLIGQLDRWVITRAAGLLTRTAGHTELAVNISSQTLTDPDLLGFLDGLTDGRSLHGRLVLEITEHVARSGVDRIARTSHALRQRGIRLALDDFGSGFASFAYLEHLQIDHVKIDGGITRGITTSTTNRLIVESIVALAHRLGMPVIAEHVEDESTRDLLAGMGIQHGQGTLLGHPITPEALLHRAPAT